MVFDKEEEVEGESVHTQEKIGEIGGRLKEILCEVMRNDSSSLVKLAVKNQFGEPCHTGRAFQLCKF